NGAVAARGEAIVFDGELTVSYDVRIHSGAFREIPVFLPRGPNRQLLLWQESGDEAVAPGVAC
ncbi:MAG: hypothetical protein GY704_13335, partial [Phycisphaeraceae bacterium]|nr:hypothetical protein [Phycisphaeraceae bacterium]